jgi:hypothetical protein
MRTSKNAKSNAFKRIRTKIDKFMLQPLHNKKTYKTTIMLKLEQANKLNEKITLLKKELKLIENAKVKSINVRIFNDFNCEYEENEILNVPRQQLKTLMTNFLKSDIENLENKLKDIFKNE